MKNKISPVLHKAKPQNGAWICNNWASNMSSQNSVYFPQCTSQLTSGWELTRLHPGP